MNKESKVYIFKINVYGFQLKPLLDAKYNIQKLNKNYKGYSEKNGGFQRTFLSDTKYNTVYVYLFPEQHRRFLQRPADRRPSLCSWMDLPEAVTVS